MQMVEILPQNLFKFTCGKIIHNIKASIIMVWLHEQKFRRRRHVYCKSTNEQCDPLGTGKNFPTVWKGVVTPVSFLHWDLLHIVSLPERLYFLSLLIS